MDSFGFKDTKVVILQVLHKVVRSCILEKASIMVCNKHWKYIIASIMVSNKQTLEIYNRTRALSEGQLGSKHCQRHNGPEGWVLLTKVTSLGHITSSYTNLDQTSSKSRPSTNSNSTKSQPNISISTKLKLKNLQQTYLQNLDQDWTS